MGQTTAPKRSYVRDPRNHDIVLSARRGGLAFATATTTLSLSIVLGLTVGIGYAGALTFIDAGLACPSRSRAWLP